MSKLRQQAIEFAAKVMEGKDYGDESLARMWSWAVFYENYVSHGADETNRRMNIVPETKVLSLSVLKGSKA